MRKKILSASRATVCSPRTGRHVDLHVGRHRHGSAEAQQKRHSKHLFSWRMSLSSAADLLRQARFRQAQGERIAHPLCVYNALGAPTCRACRGVAITDWPLHLATTAHKKNAAAIEIRTTGPDVAEATSEEPERVAESTTAAAAAKGPTLTLPSGFFDDVKAQAKAEEELAALLPRS